MNINKQRKEQLTRLASDTSENPQNNTDRSSRIRLAIHTEREILWLSFLAGAFLAACELVMSIYSHSQSVLMDAAYDATELLIIGFTIFITPFYYRPISEARPFGYAQVESFFIIIKSFMVIAVSLGLSVSSIAIAFSGGNKVNGTSISLFQLSVGAVCLVIYLFMRHLNKSIISPTVVTEIYSWRIDIGYSLGVALAFYLSSFLDKTPLAFITPYFDQIIAVCIVIFMLPPTFKMLFRAICDVFLFSPEESTMTEIKEICNPIMEDYHYQIDFYDITRTGRWLWIMIYFKIDDKSLLLEQLDDASIKVNSALSEKFKNCTASLVLTTEHSV